MSVAYTEDAVVARSKTVTRRKGWWLDKNGKHLLHAGDRLTLCRKVMGRKKGEPLVRLAEVEVVDVRREHLDALIWDHGTGYGDAEMVREGFPNLAPGEFVRRYFMDAQGISPFAEVTRIEWRYLNEADLMTADRCRWVHCPHDRRGGWFCAEHAARAKATTCLDAESAEEQ